MKRTVMCHVVLHHFSLTLSLAVSLSRCISIYLCVERVALSIDLLLLFVLLSATVVRVTTTTITTTTTTRFKFTFNCSLQLTATTEYLTKLLEEDEREDGMRTQSQKVRREALPETGEAFTGNRLANDIHRSCVFWLSSR